VNGGEFWRFFHISQIFDVGIIKNMDVLLVNFLVMNNHSNDTRRPNPMSW
jgi:hypothetical protein